MAIQSAGLLAGHLIATGPDHAASAGPDYARAWRRHFATRIHAAALFAHLAMNDGLRAGSLVMVESFPALLGWGARISGKTGWAISA